MHSFMLATLSLLTILIIPVASHGVLVSVQGSNGKSGMGFGVDPTTPRNGTARDPFQRDTSVFRLEAILRGAASPCGQTILGGPNNISTAVEAAVNAGLPAAAINGSVSMILHQVNGDGAGPYTCSISPSATGTDFVRMEVTTQVPGNGGNGGKPATDHPLVARIPSGVRCTGGPQNNACIVRCMNPRGPFGGCLAITNPPPRAAACAQAVRMLKESKRRKRAIEFDGMIGWIGSSKAWWL